MLRYAVLCGAGGGDGGGGLTDTVLVFHSGLSLTSSEFRTLATFCRLCALHGSDSSESAATQSFN